MYLLQIDFENGLIKEDPSNDSWKGISLFRDIVKKHGLQGLTVIALAADYASPLAYYRNNTERYLRAVEEVYGNRDKFKKDKLIADGLEKYDELQFDATLEQDRIIQEYKGRLLERIKAAMRDETEKGETEVNRLNKALADYENSNKKFYDNFDRNTLITTLAVTENGYVLSRIENDILTKKKSKFAHEGKDLINPNKLGL